MKQPFEAKSGDETQWALNQLKQAIEWADGDGLAEIFLNVEAARVIAAAVEALKMEKP